MRDRDTIRATWRGDSSTPTGDLRHFRHATRLDGQCGVW